MHILRMYILQQGFEMVRSHISKENLIFQILLLRAWLNMFSKSCFYTWFSKKNHTTWKQSFLYFVLDQSSPYIGCVYLTTRVWNGTYWHHWRNKYVLMLLLRAGPNMFLMSCFYAWFSNKKITPPESLSLEFML